MTPQNVIKSFIARLANHGYTVGNAEVMLNADDTIDSFAILDSAVRASSRYTSIAEVVESMKADQLHCEQASIKTVVSYYLNEAVFNNYCVNDDGSTKPLSEISSDLINYTYEDTTIGEIIKYNSAILFLSQYCGIDLDSEDTGAITGSDANVTFTADMFGEDGEQIFQILSKRYGDAAVLSDDGQTLILGTGVTKTAEDIVPENPNTYTASNNAAQIIDTGSKSWLVKATNKSDTITSNSADSIDAGDGNDIITANADGSTIATGTGNDKITISASVKDINITDLSSKDELTILGTFEVGSATVEDMTLTITDKTGTRKLKLSQFQAGTKVNVGNASTTLGQWLADKVNWSWSTATETASSVASSGSSLTVNLDEIKADSSNTVKVNGFIAGKLSNSYPDVSTFTIKGLTVHLRGQASDVGFSEIIPLTFNDLDDDQKVILAGLFKWWVREAIELNEQSYGLGFGDNATVHDIDLCFFYDEYGSLAAIMPDTRSNFDGVTTALHLNVNLEPYQNISADNVNGNSNGSGYLDRTLAHEFNHAIFDANINYFTKLPTFIKEGFAELTQGIDDFRQVAILRVAMDTDNLASQLDLTNSTNKNVTTDTYAAGYMFLRYFARQAAIQTLYFPTFGEIETVTVDFNNLNVAKGNVLYIDTAKAEATVKVAKDMATFEKLDDPYNSLLAIGEIDDLGNGTLYYYINNDLIKQNIKLGGAITNVYQLNANTNLTGSDGDDAIQLVEGGNSISGSAGDDYIELTGQYASINAGGGNDQIILTDGGHNLINLGDGDNYLELNGEPFMDYAYVYSNLYNNTITGGAGNDTVLNPAKRYFDADGYEVTEDTANAYEFDFFGYHFNSNIDLGDGNNQVHLTSLVKSSVKTGADNDVISITVLQNSTVNTGAGDDIIGFHGSGNVIDAGAGGNVIVNYGGSDNTIKTAAGSNYISVCADVEDFTLVDFGEDDAIILQNAPAKLKIEDGKLVAGNATIAGISSIAESENYWAVTSNKASYKQKLTPGVTLDGKEITYSTASGNKTLFTLTNLNSTVGVLVEGDDVILTQEALANRTADTISISGGNYNLKIDGANDGTLTLSNAQDMSFVDGTYTAAITAETFTEGDGTITYHKATGGQQFTITGLKSTAQIGRDILVGEDGKVTVKASALPTSYSEGAKVVLKDLDSNDGVNYTLTFDEEIAQDSTTHKGGWSGENGTFTFTEDYKLKGWYKNSNTYTFHNQTGGHKFKLSGFDSTVTADKFISKNISFKNDATTGYTFKFLTTSLLPKTSSISIKSLKGIENIAAANASLALDSKIATPKDIAESLTSNKGKYTYTATGKSAGWSVVNGIIVYSAQVGGDKFTLTGIKSGVKLNNGLTVSGNVATISPKALNTDEKNGAKIVLTDSNGKYSLNLNNDILQAATEVKGAFTSIKDGKAIYTATHNLSYYEPTETNTFTYRKQAAAKKITISNLKKTATTSDLDAIKVNELGDNKFTVAFNDSKILDSKAPTISADKGVSYTVTVANALNPAAMDVDWLVNGTNASLKSDTSAGYVVKSNKVVYSGKKTGSPQLSLSGLSTKASLTTPVNNTLTLKASDLGTSASLKSNASKYAVAITGDMKGKKFFGTTGNDTLNISASNASVYGSKGADNFTITGAGVTVSGGTGNDTFNVGSKGAVLAYNKGDGLDTVNYAQGLQISLSGTMKPVNVSQDSSNMIIGLGKGDSITVTNMGDTLDVHNSKESFTLSKSNLSIKDKLTFNAKKTAVTIGSALKGTISPDYDIYLNGGKLSTVSTIDGSNASGVLIVGNAKANTIIGGKNSTLQGGKGNDTFVYSSGKLTIADYASGDKISLGTAYSNYAISGNDVILGFGSNNSLTVAGGVDKSITTVMGKSSSARIYTTEGIFDSGKTAVTLSGNSFNATTYSKLATISAADSSQAVKIVGNSKSNVIIGGTGNDTLTGGAGKDTFIGGKGANVITDYTSEDKISLDVGVKLSDVSVSGKDATLKLSDGGTVKLVGVGNKKVTVVESSIDSKGKKVLKSASYIFEDRKFFNDTQAKVTLTGSAGDFSSDNKVSVITAGDTFSGKSIIGNSKANTIRGNDNGESILGGTGNDYLYGNGGADTLWGGAGNDVLTGGAGFDTFVYKPGEGKDTIMDYESGELLTILDSTFKGASFSNSVLTLSIDGGGSVIFKKVGTSTDFNINGTTYKISGKKLV